MLAIKSLADRLRKRAGARVAHEHARPGDRLQQRPVQAQSQDQQETVTIFTGRRIKSFRGSVANLTLSTFADYA
jgi:hypothetical protein